MGPSCPLVSSFVGPTSKSSLFGHIINTLLSKLVQSEWLKFGLVLFFCLFIFLGEVKKELKKELGQCPARLKTLSEKSVRGRSAGSFPDQRLVIEPNTQLS